MRASESVIAGGGRSAISVLVVLSVLVGCTSSGDGGSAPGTAINVVAPASCSTSGCVGEGVDTADGSYSVATADLLFPAGVYGIELERTYRSSRSDAGMFGPGWATVYDTALKATAEGVTVLAPVGLQPRWQPEAPAGWGISGGARLSGGSGVARQISWPSGETWTFDGNGQLAQMRSPFGQVVSIDRAEGIPVAITSTQGVGVRLEHAEGKVVSVTANDQRTVTYQYADGLLAAVSAPGLIESYRYNSDKRLLEVSSPVATTSVTYLDGRVSTQVFETGQSLALSYGDGITTVKTDVERQFEHDGGGRLTRVSQDGRDLELRAFDDDGRVVSARQLSQPGDRVVSELVREYQNGRLTVETVNGISTAWSYDDVGRVTAVRSLDGTKSFAYDGDQPLPTVASDPSTGREELKYEDGFLVSSQDATGVVTSILRDQLGNPTSRAVGEGAAWSFAFDAEGNVVSTTSPSGRVWEADWGPRGLLVGETDPLGRKSTYEYDDGGRLLSKTDPGGRMTAYDYGSSGRLQRQTDPDGSVTAYEYDSEGNLAATTFPGERIWRSARSKLVDGGTLVSVTAPDGTVTESTLDSAGRETRRRALEVDGSLVEERTVEYEYDRAVLEVVRRGSSRLETKTSYDGAGRAVRVVQSLDGVELGATNYTFEAGTLVEASNEDGTAQYRYDDAGRLVEVVTGEDSWLATFSDGRLVKTAHNAATTTISYDLDGRADTFEDPLGVITKWTFDAVDRPIGRSVGEATASFEWSAGDELVRYQGPTGSSWRWEYDAAGRLTRAIEPHDQVTEYEYEHGAVVRITSNGDDERDDRFSYDARGLLQRAETSAGRFEYRYDAAGLLEAIDAEDNDEEWTRDAAGNVIAVQAGDDVFALRYENAGRLSAVVGPEARLLASWNEIGLASVSAAGRDTIGLSTDDQHRLSSVQWDDDTAIDLAWSEDATRLLLSERGGDERQEYRIADGRIEAFSTDGLSMAAAYQANGAPQSLRFETDDSQGEVRFDQLARPATLVADRATATLAYDTAGRVASAVVVEPGSEPRTTSVGYADGKRSIDGDGSLIDALFAEDGSLLSEMPTSLPTPVAAASSVYDDGQLNPASSGALLVAPEPRPLEGIASSIRSATPSAVTPIGVRDLPRLAEQMAVAEIDRLSPELKADGRAPVRLPIINPKNGKLAEFNPFLGAAPGAKALRELGKSEQDSSLFDRVTGTLGDIIDGAVRIGRDVGRFLLENPIARTLVVAGAWIGEGVACSTGVLCAPASLLFGVVLLADGAVNISTSVASALRTCPRGEVARCGLDVLTGVIGLLEIGAAGRAFGRAFRPTAAGSKVMASPETGDVSVYTAIDPAGNTQYVGITNDPARRAAEHLAEKEITINPIAGLTSLTRADARAVEQVLIEANGGPSGSQLLNKIYSIARSNPMYDQSVRRGCQLLSDARYLVPGGVCP